MSTIRACIICGVDDHTFNIRTKNFERIGENYVKKGSRIYTCEADRQWFGRNHRLKISCLKKGNCGLSGCRACKLHIFKQAGLSAEYRTKDSTRANEVTSSQLELKYIVTDQPDQLPATSVPLIQRFNDSIKGDLTHPRIPSIKQLANSNLNLNTNSKAPHTEEPVNNDFDDIPTDRSTPESTFSDCLPQELRIENMGLFDPLTPNDVELAFIEEPVGHGTDRMNTNEAFIQQQPQQRFVHRDLSSQCSDISDSLIPDQYNSIFDLFSDTNCEKRNELIQSEEKVGQGICGEKILSPRNISAETDQIIRSRESLDSVGSDYYKATCNSTELQSNFVYNFPAHATGNIMGTATVSQMKSPSTRASTLIAYATSDDAFDIIFDEFMSQNSVDVLCPNQESTQHSLQLQTSHNMENNSNQIAPVSQKSTKRVISGNQDRDLDNSGESVTGLTEIVKSYGNSFQRENQFENYTSQLQSTQNYNGVMSNKRARVSQSANNVTLAGLNAIKYTSAQANKTGQINNYISEQSFAPQSANNSNQKVCDSTQLIAQNILSQNDNMIDETIIQLSRIVPQESFPMSILTDNTPFASIGQLITLPEMEKQTSKLVNKAKPHIKALLGKDSRNNKESGATVIDTQILNRYIPRHKSTRCQAIVFDLDRIVNGFDVLGNIFEKKLDFIYFRDNDSNHRKIITLLNGLSKDTALNALVLKFNGMVLARQSVRDDSSTDKVLYIKEIVESLPVKLEKTIKIFIFDIFSKESVDQIKEIILQSQSFDNLTYYIIACFKTKESWRDFSKFMTRFEEVFSKILAKHAVNHHLGQICEKVYQELKALLGANGCPDIHVFGIGQTSELYLCPVY